MKLWRDWMRGCKFLIVRRDGTIPAWAKNGAFVLGARDPAAPWALREYARAAQSLGMDAEYCASVRALADKFDEYRRQYGDGDPDKPPHRKDNMMVVGAMETAGGRIVIESVVVGS